MPARRGPRSRRRSLLVGTAIVVTAIAAGASWIAVRGDGASPAVVDDPGAVHVHGLGVNPADGALFAATHTGLFRIDDAGRATRIADRHQDTMGFTVAGPDRFLASGHPDLREDELRAPGKPPLLGLVESVDGGRTWRARSLLGEADLHTIAAVGDLLVAYDSTGGRVLASTDGGRTWDTRSEAALTDLAVDPAQPDRMAAVGVDGAMRTSSDGGRTWTAGLGAPPGVAVLRWSADGLYAGGRNGALYRAGPTGDWASVHTFAGEVEALAADGDVLYAAVRGSGIYASRDRGESWQQLYRSQG